MTFEDKQNLKYWLILLSIIATVIYIIVGWALDPQEQRLKCFDEQSCEALLQHYESGGR